jgi:hypothetical protein
MSSILFYRDQEKTSPVPASGIHAELLTEMSQAASALIKLIELERTGVYDGFGQNFWTGFDSVLNTAQRLVALAERRAAELRDAGPR